MIDPEYAALCKKELDLTEKATPEMMRRKGVNLFGNQNVFEKRTSETAYEELEMVRERLKEMEPEFRKKLAAYRANKAANIRNISIV